MKRLIVLLCAVALFGCGDIQRKKDHQIIEVYKTESPIALDGKATENAWHRANWYALDQNWLGEAYTHEDFKGRYKVCWDEDQLYMLVEITDDTLYDNHEDPLKHYWDDDCLEVFVDQDNSGGLHQFSHNAFAYHIALDGNVVDLSPAREPRLYNDHLSAKLISEGSQHTWELSLRLYGDSYMDDGKNTAVKLSKDQKIGFAMAYCDNDSSSERENFIGSVFIPGEDKNRAWIDADLFGTLLLKE